MHLAGRHIHQSDILSVSTAWASYLTRAFPLAHYWLRPLKDSRMPGRDPSAPTDRRKNPARKSDRRQAPKPEIPDEQREPAPDGPDKTRR